MTWNFYARPEETIAYDCETQSLADLRKVGMRQYAADPSTRISIAGFKGLGRQTMWVLPGVTPPGIQVPEGWELHQSAEPPDWIAGHTLVAHNADFDKTIWDTCVKIPMSWTDSMPMARAAGLPGGLDKIGKALFGIGKHEAGHVLINMLCKARVQGGRVMYPICTAGAWTKFIDYCIQDVELLYRLFPIVFPFNEPEVISVSQTINDRGIPVDAPFAARLVLLQDELVLKRGDEFAELTDLNPADARSGKKVMEWLDSVGVKLPMKNGKPTLDKKELNRLFKEPEAFVDGPNDELAGAIEVLKIRMEITRATAGKALSVVKLAEADGRVRGQLLYHGAHTGRYSGRGIQPQNFVKGVKGLGDGFCRVDLTLEEVEAEAARLGVSVSDVIASLTRPIIGGFPMTVTDFAAIEARGVAYLVDEEAELTEFRKWTGDPYVVLASQIFGRPITKADELERFVGKALILGCGYSMSWRKFVLYCAVQNVDLGAANVDAQNVVKIYRQTHPRIVNGWKQLHDAIHLALEGKETTACKCRIFKEGNDVHIQLPSGRRIVYRNARMEMLVPAYAALFGVACDPLPTFVFDHPHGYKGMLYGGRAMENVVQAMCRDILVEKLIDVEAAGLSPFLHAHDEICSETEDIDLQTAIMSRPPRWAPDFPMMVESFAHNRYTKTPPKTCQHRVGLNGEVR